MEGENEVIHLLKTGKEGFLKVLFDAYYEKLCLYAEGIIKDHHAAEEIVEDLFIYCWVNAGKLSIHTSLKSYLFTSIHNNCLKYLSRSRIRGIHLSKSYDSLEKQELRLPATEEVPLSCLIVDEIELKAEKILSSLPDRCREIYSLNRYEGLSYTQIAKKLDITVGTVKTQMFRAFEKLREGLKEYLHF